MNVLICCANDKFNFNSLNYAHENAIKIVNNNIELCDWTLVRFLVKDNSFWHFLCIICIWDSIYLWQWSEWLWTVKNFHR